MSEPYPEPFARGLVEVGEGQLVSYERCGTPGATPVLFCHGGPGQGCSPAMRRAADPDRFDLVLVDQRGCGRSLPHAGNPSTDLSVNTTSRLVADLELLRNRLGLGPVVLLGGSWGTVLALAYAERHPESVRGLVLTSIMTGRRTEFDWLYRGARRFFPEEFERFAAAAGAGADPARLPAAYGPLLADPDPAIRLAAARAWGRWEDALLSLEPGGRAGFFSEREGDVLVASARLCAHYAEHGAFLAEGELIAGAHRLAGLPGLLVHGRLDLSCPVETAYELAEAWPGAELVVVDEAGHRGHPDKRAAIERAMDAFAAA